MNNQFLDELSVSSLIKTINDQNLMLLRAQDREIGLVQELNTVKSGFDREKLVIELNLIKSSASYKIARFISFPFRALEKLIGYLYEQAWKLARLTKKILKKFI